MLKTLIFLLLVNFASSKLTWRLISAKNDSDEFPSPRRDSSIGFLRTTNQLVIFGGKGSGGNLDDTWIFDLQTGSWRRLENLTPVPHKRFSMAYGAAENSFYISTGEYSGSPRTFFNDIWKFDLTAGGRWERLDDENAEVKPEVRYGSAGGIFDDGSGNNGFYITHGFSETRYSNTFKFDFGQRKWVEKFSGSNNYDPKYPHSRCLHGGTLTNPDEIVMYGGCLGGGLTGGPCPSKDNWKFDATTGEWTRLEECSTPRIYPAMAILPPANGSERRAVLYGGQEKTKSVLGTPEYEANEIAVFNPATNEWKRKKVEGTSPPRRAGHVMAMTDKGIIVFGGTGQDGEGLLNDIWLLEGTASDADGNPSAGGCGSSDFNLIALHGLFMFLGWGVLLQAGAFIARYFRHVENAFWFKMHRGLQVSGLLLALAGFICAIMSVPFDHFKFAHGGLGLVIMIIGLTQPLNALFRPHPTDENGIKSKGRFIWEIFHKNAGRLALLLALINITLGFFLAVVPVAVWATWFAVFGLYVIVHIMMEIRFIMRDKRAKTVTIPMK